MRRIVVSAGVGLIAVGLAMTANLLFRREVPSTPLSAVARVVCEPDQVVVEDDAVRANPDGVHFEVENVSRAQLLELTLVGLDSPPLEAPIPSDRITRATFTLPPGPVAVACTSGRGDGRDREPALLTVLDTEELWISPDLSCEAVESTSFAAAFAGEDELSQETARRSVAGLLAADVLAKPGYPQTRWHGDLLVVIREGETVGRITRAQHEGAWLIDIDACSGSGLV